MIKLNLNNAVKLESITKFQKKVKHLSDKMEHYESEGSEFLGWKDITTNSKRIKDTIEKVEKESKRLKKEEVEVLVVIGIGGSSAGAKAAIKMINGNFPKNKKDEVMFVGEGMSSTEIAQQLSYLQDKNFAINVISKSGTTLETSITFRIFKRLLQEKVGATRANKLIIATTDANNGLLLNQAIRNNWTRFVIPDSIGGRFSILTPVGLLPMAFSGIKIKKVMEGATRANKIYSKDSLINNDAYRYAVARHILSKKFQIELMVQTENQMSAFTDWWIQLSGESEGKNGKGLFPAGAIFSKDLHSLGQYIQDGTKNLFETIIKIEKPNINVKIFKTQDNLDNLNYLFERTIHEINSYIVEAAKEAHIKIGKVPNIEISIEKMDEINLGYLIIFFQRSTAMSCYLNDVNPFNQPGVEAYKLNLKKALKK